MVGLNKGQSGIEISNIVQVFRGWSQGIPVPKQLIISFMPGICEESLDGSPAIMDSESDKCP